MPLKIFLFIVVPAAIVYIFWVTYKKFERTKPERGSKEDIENHKNDFL